MRNEIITVSELHAIINQTLSFAYPEVLVEGEVANFKINQGKWVFFDLKDDDSVVSCFMPIFQLKTAVEDGMKVRIVAVPQLTKWGKFSLTVRSVELAGEGSVKRAFELLKAKLEAEGLFEIDRKRPLPKFPQRVLLITSKQAAAFNDFVSILNDRWSGLEIDHLQVQVQGDGAPDQIVGAINYANSHQDNYDVVVMVRGGGSPEDLQAFSTEQVARAVFASAVPMIVAIGHEDDVCLAELVADQRGATPTDAARRLVPDRNEVLSAVGAQLDSITNNIQLHVSSSNTLLERFYQGMSFRVAGLRQNYGELIRRNETAINMRVEALGSQLSHLHKLLVGLDPRAILARGYSIARVGNRVIKSGNDISSNDVVVLQLHEGTVDLQRRKNNSRQDDEQTQFPI